MAGLPGDIAYTSSKGALRSMAISIAVYCARSKYDIRCNSIHAGITETPNIVRSIEATDDPAAPLGRMARSEGDCRPRLLSRIEPIDFRYRSRIGD
jgi:NAD(P)-dependent dehydrogenase (short-subunit alcohol dehydrogenase family)